MKRSLAPFLLAACSAWLAFAATARAQRRPYIGYAYPAGGQQATTFEVKLGGQDLDDVERVFVTGSGVSARITSYYRRLNPQEMQLLREQLKTLQQASPKTEATQELIAKVEKRIREWVQTPACASLAGIAIAEVTIAPDAEAGSRELRLGTPRGVSNPLVFQVGQLFEYSRRPMLTATLHILGKEQTALRNRPAGEVEDRVTIPCTLNGQIAAREVNRYRFSATKGQRLVISTQARQLIPFVADAVPGWFQPVLALYDAQGRELAYADDYQFKPDPVILYQVEHDGDYVCEIRDSLYRGREDFVYRISIGELPFVTSVFPLGRPANSALMPNMTGWNVADADLGGLAPDARGLQSLAAYRLGFRSNPVPFAIDALPETLEREGNDTAAAAQPVTLPLIVNGRIQRPDDSDVFAFAGKAGQAIVAEVEARRLDSPLDSVLKLTDASGAVLAFNDDREDLTAGINTHHADSYLTAKLPADGTYRVHIGDTARHGGEEYGYRLRLSEPQPDFEVRVVPSSINIPLNSTATLTVYVARRDGFNGPIKLALQPSAGFSAPPVTLTGAQSTGRFTIRAGATATPEPVRLVVTGTAKIGPREVVRTAVAAEDRMQAFLWRHLVPAGELLAKVFDPRYQPPPKRVPPQTMPALIAAVTSPAPAPQAAKAAPSAVPTTATTTTAEAPKPKFSKQQIAGRLRQLKLLYEEGLLTDAFYEAKVAECEASQ